ncbi:MAG: hypothetical protein ABJG41_01515 [Cyclobacteriaceae bacterium]
MIQTKQIYQHKKSPLKMQTLNESPIHDQHWHVGLIIDGTIVFNCHVHKKDIGEDWELEHNLGQTKQA